MDFDRIPFCSPWLTGSLARLYVVDGRQSIGMEFLHAHNVCHRDLKSANVLFDRKLHVKLCDFAFSKFRQVQAEAEGDAAEAKFISSVGTPAWMAPEVLRGDECVTFNDTD